MAAAMEAAERDRDWAVMGELAPRFEQVLKACEPLVQALSALAILAPERLVLATANLVQLFAAMMVVWTLTDLDPLLESENPFIQFSIILRVGPGARFGLPKPHLAETRLVDLLAKAAKDPPRWRGWMKAFNRYPNRFPDLQSWLGQALASAPKSALQAFVDGLELYGSADPPGRAAASEAFRAFRSAAPLAQRRRLWRLAFQRWRAWEFAAPERDNVLTEIAKTSLDYAIVGYWLECRNDAERAVDLNEAHQAIILLESAWFTSVVTYHSAWRRDLSRLQPIRHAQRVLTEQLDWLQRPELNYLTFDPKLNRYAVAKLGWR